MPVNRYLEKVQLNYQVSQRKSFTSRILCTIASRAIEASFEKAHTIMRHLLRRAAYNNNTEAQAPPSASLSFPQHQQRQQVPSSSSSIAPGFAEHQGGPAVSDTTYAYTDNTTAPPIWTNDQGNNTDITSSSAIAFNDVIDLSFDQPQAILETASDRLRRQSE
ncbi:hypothetical protein HGRIS_008521 [Hohenbuehelia grisea]|uniref:Uncharacterized protein n=1 Tax=Hohenbuehelia grisea TaxID=104357 RepID=A0ABR3J8I4_9AGAR